MQSRSSSEENIKRFLCDIWELDTVFWQACCRVHDATKIHLESNIPAYTSATKQADSVESKLYNMLHRAKDSVWHVIDVLYKQL